MEGVKEAIKWAIQYNKTQISIYYDYEGIEKWATGQWTAKKAITKDYVRFIQDNRLSLQIECIKVPAHTGVKFNEEVDAIAKNALLAKRYNTYNGDSVYVLGYTVQDWEVIIQGINYENVRLAEEAIAPLVLNKEAIGTREKIKVTQAYSTVVINCYKHSNSYMYK